MLCYVSSVNPPLVSSVGADRHVDITFRLQVVECSSLVSVLFREVFNHPYISFFHLVINGFSVIYFKLVGCCNSSRNIVGIVW